ncbi:MAG TPA: pyridoxal-phosphate dependent enzyme [Verrucomicrobiae bacterium]|nr:pyridoxal-phosphate dependent enzyme [Verrucomicrobiae bacterium]
MHPENNPPLPLVELPDELNPFAGQKVRIFAKLMSALPLSNVKSLPALNMLLQKEQSGELQDVNSIVENSSGNTVMSLAVLGRIFGIPRTKAIVSHEVSPGKLELLRFFGTEISINEEPICPDPRDKTSGIYQAKELGKQPGIWNPGQYENPANPEAHARWTGPQIWEQTGGQVTLFCAGLGTTGSMVGTGAYFKTKNPNILNLGVIRQPNNPVPGVRTKNLLQEIAFDWNGSVDRTVEIGTLPSYERSLELCRAGILAGPSSGFALAGLLAFLEKAEPQELDRYRNENGDVLAVFLCPDSPFPYIQEYFEFLPEERFPAMENAHLLIHKAESPKKTASPTASQLEIASDEAYRQIYACSPSEAWTLIDAGSPVPAVQNVVVADVRDEHEFAHAHLPNAVHLDYRTALRNPEDLGKTFEGKTVFVICNRGNRSLVAAQALQAAGVHALSIAGGFMKWSEENLPRWRPDVCIAFQKDGAE